jgi:hypothetical protein
MRMAVVVVVLMEMEAARRLVRMVVAVVASFELVAVLVFLPVLG